MQRKFQGGENRTIEHGNDFDNCECVSMHQVFGEKVVRENLIGVQKCQKCSNLTHSFSGKIFHLEAREIVNRLQPQKSIRLEKF